MKNETKDAIETLLIGIMPRAEKLDSIEEKKRLYKQFLDNNKIFLDVDEEIDIESSEVEELIVDNFLSININEVQVFDDGYQPWLDDVRKDISWNFYDRYEKYLLTKKRWNPASVASIKKISDIILDHMVNPKTKDIFHNRGLVIGDIQSGKTANYTAVINKAIDAGYKIVIVLAGLTRDLRNQTQKRLDSEVLGYETKTKGKGKNIGVGEIKPLNIEGLTYADDEKDFGDMKKYFSTHTLDSKLNPIVAIVKKNTSVLNHLNDFIMNSQDYCYSNKKLDIPVLIIDDEVDQASVDTKNSEELENASAINKKIRTILNNLNRYSYIGYTATPFANVFIDPDKENDLYPKDFILNLPSSKDYCGIKEYFGVDIHDENDYTSDHKNDLFVNIKDYGDLFPKGARISASTQTEALNESLKDAVMSFIISSSIKKSRGIIGYNSMLIHIARFKNPATTLRPLVNDFLDKMYHKVKYEYYDAIKEFEKHWKKNFEKVSKIRLKNKYSDNWKSISNHILPTIESAMNNVKVLNGDSGDFLDYSSAKSGDYIIIGGDKLSRGLTLEGLVVSYYYRNSNFYDSLLQMGRWFGYRSGWVDVCRVYTTTKFMNNFINVGKVLQRFKSDIQVMYEQRLNPRQVGQRIACSPNLIPTARNKMRTATKLKVSFSNEVQQIITFDRKNSSSNLELTKDFIKKLGEGEIHQNNKVVFRNIKPDTIIDFLSSYKECDSYSGYGYISIKNWIEYIRNLTTSNELTNWTVVLNSLKNIKPDYDNSINFGKYTIYKPSRTLRESGDSSSINYYTVKAIIDPRDFAEFFDVNSEEYKTVDHYEPAKQYDGFTEKEALMSIYVIDLYEKELIDEYDENGNQKAIRGKRIEDGTSVCSVAIWFPRTKDYERSATTYYVSKDYLKYKENDDNEYEAEDNE